MTKNTTKTLPSQNVIRAALAYDEVTGVFVWRWREDMPLNWNRRRAGAVAGHANDKGYIVIGLNGTVYLGHRLAWVYVHGDGVSVHDDIDHKSGVTSDNRIGNLRIATDSQNMGNRKATRERILPKGVHKSRHRFRAIIRTAGRNINLGFFATVGEAQDAYMVAAKEKNGEFARAA